MTTTLKNKVISKLEKWGNNPEEVKTMVDLHFEQGSRLFESNVKSIAEFIRMVY